MNAAAFLKRFVHFDRALARLARTRDFGPLGSATIGVGCAAGALIIRLALSSAYQNVTGFMILMPGVILAALAAGRIGGLTAVAASLAGGWAITWDAAGGPGAGLQDNLFQVATVNFIVVGAFCSLVGASLRKTLSRLDSSLAALESASHRIHDTEDRLNIISEQAPVMLWMSDATGKCVHLNAEQRQFWKAPSELSRFDFAGTVHPDDRERLFALTHAAAEAREPMTVETRSLRHDGQWRTLRTDARPRLDRDGNFLGMIGVNVDVTDQREAEAARRESEDRFRLIADNIPNLAWMAEADGSIYWYNRRWYDYTGTTPAEMEGWGWQAVHDSTMVDGVTERFKEAVANGERWEDTFPLRSAAGEWRWFLSRAMPIRNDDGEVVRWFGTNTDITEQRQAEVALRESEARFRLMADTAPSPVWLTNAPGEVEFVNKALVAFYGQPEESILGHVWKQALHPDDVEAVAAIQAEHRPQHTPYGFEARFARADGVWRWMRVSVNPRFDATGGFMGYVGMSFDVTDTREAIDALAAQERRQSFLLDLTDRLRDLGEADQIMAEVERSLGDLLGVGRVGYGEVDQDRGLVAMSRDWTAGVSSAEGQFTLADLGAELIEDLSRGVTIRIDDVKADPRTVDARPVFETLQTRALMRAPLIRGGRLRAFLYLHHPEPRIWTDSEAALLEEVASRTWAEIERTRAEADVRESEQRFRAIADTAPVLIWVTAQDRVRAFVNQAYVAFNGGTYEEARLADWRAVLHPDDHERILAESLAGEATGQPFSLEARFLRHDGTYRWLKSFSRPRLGSGGVVLGFVGVAFDVTDMREAQARLLESETRFRTVADSAPALIWMTDVEGAVTFTNRRFKTFFEVDTEAQAAEGWERMVEPEDRLRFEAAFQDAIGRRDRFEDVFRVDHPSLGLRWLRCEALPRFDGAGVFQGYVGANIDVSDAKRAEDDLKRINELLEDRVGEALAEKAKAEADLMHAQRMEAVGRLTGGVAHDFNNLLTVVIGALDMILRAPDDAAKRKRLGEAALSAARRGERLTHQLLAFSRRQTLRPEPVDLNRLIRESEPLLKRAVGEAVDFRLKLKRGGARVKVDPAQFEAALLNLVVNARDAVSDGGAIVVATQACAVGPDEQTDLTAGDYVCVTVSDNGSGIPPEVLARVFEPFFTTKPVGKGTGLGLSQVYGFARQSGGGARITSEPGKGTEIRLFLPPLDAALREAVEAAPAGAGPGVAGQSLLLVEDDAGVAAVAVDLLRELGLEVTAVESGPRALEALEGRTFNIMLSDVIMPGGMSGVDLARRVAADHPDMRIVLASGYAGEDVDDTLANAPWPFLRKPYSAAELGAVLAGDATPA